MSRILIVEDEPAIALGLEDDLKMEGYQVEVAADGITAARRAREGAFDLILLDVMLPGKDGFDVCRELRRAGLKTPILMLTAKARKPRRSWAWQIGDERVYSKIPPGTQSGQKLRLREKGVPSATKDGVRGDEIVEIKVTVPMPRDEKTKELLREVAKLNPEDPRADLWTQV